MGKKAAAAPTVVKEQAKGATTNAPGEKLSEERIQTLLSTAREHVEKEAKRSILLERNAPLSMSEFSTQETHLGRTLGTGGFSVVKEIVALKLQSNVPEQKLTSEGDDGLGSFLTNSRQVMSERCFRNGDARYAIKKIKPELYRDEEQYLLGVVCLALEAKFLSAVSHPHIIRMRAIGSGGPYQDGFFILLDRLYDTLDKRILTWKKKSTSSKALSSIMGTRKKRQNSLLCETIMVAHDISTALWCLHSHQLVYRDLKPENIGFDVRNDVKLFDLGLAKELHPDDCVGEKQYKLTPHSGSLRYMAPEVALSKPYYLSADAYSFAMVFWEMLMFEEPFRHYSVRIHKDRVFEQGYRPGLNEAVWSKELCRLLQLCWHETPTKRPSMKKIGSVLYEEASKLDPESAMDMDISNKTDKSLRSFRQGLITT